MPHWLVIKAQEQAVTACTALRAIWLPISQVSPVKCLLVSLSLSPAVTAGVCAALCQRCTSRGPKGLQLGQRKMQGDCRARVGSGHRLLLTGLRRKAIAAGTGGAVGALGVVPGT